MRRLFVWDHKRINHFARGPVTALCYVTKRQFPGLGYGWAGATESHLLIVLKMANGTTLERDGNTKVIVIFLHYLNCFLIMHNSKNAERPRLCTHRMRKCLNYTRASEGDRTSVGIDIFVGTVLSFLREKPRSQQWQPLSPPRPKLNHSKLTRTDTWLLTFLIAVTEF